jgi:DeoD family purine-nucleoside phosphorylase
LNAVIVARPVDESWRRSLVSPARVTIHLHPTAPLAQRVLLPGDPGRALVLAQTLLDEARMFNHNRGLWGYTGNAADGRPLTIQSTGMGGPSAAIVIFELAALGARRLLRVGTCGSLTRELQLGDLLVATEAIPADGTSRALGAPDRTAPDPALAAALVDAVGQAGRAGAVASTDLFYDVPEAEQQRWVDHGAIAVEMETATLFTLAAKRHLQAAALLLVTDLLVPARQRIAERDLRAGEHRLGTHALRALTRCA